jgi:hypothetical protein
MENNGIINFNDFFKGDEPKKIDFNKEDFNDFFLSEETEEITESVTSEEEEEAYVPNEEEKKEDEFMLKSEEEESVEETHESYYSVYKDKSEDFSCDIQLEGANLDETQARLILESDDWTLMFNGEIDRKGKCVIPIKKLAILNEGVIGKIRLEVIAEGSVFIPWEDEFKVKLSKKVSVKLNESKSSPKKPEYKKAGVKINVKR